MIRICYIYMKEHSPFFSQQFFVRVATVKWYVPRKKNSKCKYVSFIWQEIWSDTLNTHNKKRKQLLFIIFQVDTLKNHLFLSEEEIRSDHLENNMNI